MLKLIRDSYSDMGTFGKLYIDNEFFCYTVEQVWKDNRENESCIPEGVYSLQLRYSPVVKRTSAGEFEEGYEITNVLNRTYVMLHVANVASDLQACIGVGESLGFVKDQWAVLNSRNTFRKLMHKLEERNDWDIEITQRRIEYP